MVQIHNHLFTYFSSFELLVDFLQLLPNTDNFIVNILNKFYGHVFSLMFGQYLGMELPIHMAITY